MKKIVWLVVSCLMALSLILVSCGGDEGTGGTTTGGSDEPQYGGTITTRELSDPLCCDSFGDKMMSYGGVTNSY